MTIAGILDVKDALILVARRAELIGVKCVPRMSGMVTCKSTADQIDHLLGSNDPRFSGISIACLNAPTDIVVAGPIDPLHHFVEHCKSNGVQAKQLTVPYGFHSACMDPILDELKASVSSIKIRPCKIPFGSSLHGKLINIGERLEHGYLVNHTRDSVKFYRVIGDIQNSFRDTDAYFVEIGPYPSSKSSIRCSPFYVGNLLTCSHSGIND